MTSTRDLEQQLHALVEQVYGNAEHAATLMQALKQEIAFLAECEQPGHRFVVEVLDLGSYDTDRSPTYTIPAPRMNRSDFGRGHTGES